jgi:antitoxin (DNA-binding transcriptional repressor) of toxin-antitoxin stability system
LRLNPVASRELRLGDYRVLYDAAEEDWIVNVRAVGEKQGNRFCVQGGSSRLMRVIDLQEAKANLEQYAVECQSSPVVVTKEGQPIFELLPIRPDDTRSLEDLMEHDPSFRNLIEERREEVRSGRVSSIEAVRQRLLGSED